MTTPPSPPVDWHQLADGLGEIDGDTIAIAVGNTRRHVIQVVQHKDAWEISGIAATAEELMRADRSALDLWRQNEHRTLSSYVVETDGAAWVTTLVPYSGTTAEEFCYLAKLVATEADWLEFQLTGADSY